VRRRRHAERVRRSGELRAAGVPARRVRADDRLVRRPTVCPDCPPGTRCDQGKCVDCTPQCQPGELACGDDQCGGSCGSCPDARWTCHAAGICCIRNNQQCHPLLEGCNCCPGLFCISGFCTPAAGCAMAPGYTPGVFD
jgi:hypothetical protein